MTTDLRDSEKPHANEQAGLITASALCLLVAAVFAGGYAWWNGDSLLGTLSLQILLATASVLATWHLIRLSRLHALVESAEDARQALTARRSVRRSAGWDDEEGYERDAEHQRQALREDEEHDRNVHFLLYEVLPALIVGAIAATTLFRLRAVEGVEATTGQLVFGLICLAAACVWIVLARTFESLTKGELPGAAHLGLVFRETQWASLLSSGALLGSFLWAPLPVWIARLLAAWVVAICVEQLVRAMWVWRQKPDERSDGVPLYPLALRQSLLEHGNPLTSLLESFERRFGVSFRTSWTIRFVRRAFLPILVLSSLLYWGLTSLALIGPHEVGLRENCGVFVSKLEPGLHWKLPWPLGQVRRFEVHRVHIAEVGVELGEVYHRPRAILWSKGHTDGDHPLVLGTGTDAVNVDALVYYKIRDDLPGLLDHAYHVQNPIEAMLGYAERCLMEHTRSATLAEVLSVDRAEFAGSLESDLRQYIEANRLGIEIIDLALLNLHPPVASAPAYLDVISAGIDAVRFQLEAEGEKKARVEDAESEAGQLIAHAKASAARRVGGAVEESAQFVAVGQAFALAPDAFKLRMSGDAIVDVLGNKSLTLVDPTFVGGDGELLLDMRGELRRDGVAETR